MGKKSKVSKRNRRRDSQGNENRANAADQPSRPVNYDHLFDPRWVRYVRDTMGVREGDLRPRAAMRIVNQGDLLGPHVPYENNGAFLVPRFRSLGYPPEVRKGVSFIHDEQKVWAVYWQCGAVFIVVSKAVLTAIEHGKMCTLHNILHWEPEPGHPLTIDNNLLGEENDAYWTLYYRLAYAMHGRVTIQCVLTYQPELPGEHQWEWGVMAGPIRVDDDGFVSEINDIIKEQGLWHMTESIYNSHEQPHSEWPESV